MIKVNSLQGYEGTLDCYSVDEHGNIFSEYAGLLKTHDNGRGYLQVSLKLKGKRSWKKVYVHRLVALAFVPNPEGKLEVNHIDENKINNRADNLEWITHAENNRYGTKNVRMVQTRCDDIFVYDWRLNFIGKFTGISEATRQTLGRVETRRLNGRTGDFFFLNAPIEKFGKKKFLRVVEKSRYRPVVVENVITGEKKFFATNREARRFFGDKINVTDAIKHDWLIQKTYKVYNLDYADLIDSPNLRKKQP